MISPDTTDPDRIGASLTNLGEVILPCLDGVRARSVVEIGASHGDFTAELLVWAARSDARVTAVDPAPERGLIELAERDARLRLIQEPSGEALRHLPAPDAVIVDGDHNYYTVSEELRLIAGLAGDGPGSLVLLHDVGWPHGRRDRYYEVGWIPPEHRHPVVARAHLDPAEPGIVERGLYFESVAEREGGPGNGVLTAVEDFLDAQPDLRLAVIPAFFGLAVLWPRNARWAAEIAGLVEPLDRDPLLTRLEENRILQLVKWAAAQQAGEREVARLERELHAERELRRRRDEFLRVLAGSRAFAVGEYASRLRHGGRPTFSRAQVRRLLEDSGPS